MSKKNSPDSLRDGLHEVNPQAWVSNYADQLYCFARLRLKDESKARDLIQETFLSALEGLDKFRGDSSEQAWLTAILKNKIFSFYRFKSGGLANVDIAHYEEFNDTDGSWSATYIPGKYGTGYEDCLEKTELRPILQKYLQSLPSLWLAVFTMKHIDGETTKAVCEQLQVSQANLWVIMHRTKVRLRFYLQKHWD